MGELADYLNQHDSNFRKSRLPALYSDFRSQRTLNPDGYQANISAWNQALSHLASQGILSKYNTESSPLILKIDNSILRHFESRQFGQPLALGTVVREAVAAKNLVPLNDFLKAQTNIYQRGWGQLPWTVVGWTLRQLGVVDPARGEDTLPAGRYVAMQNLESAAAELSERMAGKTSIFDRVFTKTQFETTFATELVPGQRLSEQDIDVLLRFLAREKQTVEYDGQTVRIKGGGDGDRKLTEEDATVASIKELTANLKHQISLLNTRVEELEQTARSAVMRKHKISALAALKSKKIAEASLASRYTTLNQLEDVANKIQQAADQVQLLKVMESSASVLKTLNAATGGVEKVDSVMDRLREQMGTADEVAAILAESVGAPIDEAEIDEELEALEELEKEKEEAAKRAKEEAQRKKEEAEALEKLEKLPEVPVADEPAREKAQTPTSETGIANLSIESQPEKEAELLAN
ncbi:unnamed protein product [Clonostachys chloroleuca]|uniref:Uncharacterized protein n=1 Tax=Clonostachys chloroleuca TaxID=1926264 RepID=A0AA35LZJ2_9HYPO|nr:unnamed protein product [Clonostachys chloroleuca]